MDREKLRVLLEALQDGEMTVGEAMESFRRLPFEDLGFAKLDTHRSIRRGFPEVVYCPGKTPGQVASILQSLSRDADRVLATRAESEVFDAVKEHLSEAELAYFPEARLILVGLRPPRSAARSWSPPAARPIDRWPRRRRSPVRSWAIGHALVRRGGGGVAPVAGSAETVGDMAGIEYSLRLAGDRRYHKP